MEILRRTYLSTPSSDLRKDCCNSAYSKTWASATRKLTGMLMPKGFEGLGTTAISLMDSFYCSESKRRFYVCSIDQDGENCITSSSALLSLQKNSARNIIAGQHICWVLYESLLVLSSVPFTFWMMKTWTFTFMSTQYKSSRHILVTLFRNIVLQVLTCEHLQSFVANTVTTAPAVVKKLSLEGHNFWFWIAKNSRNNPIQW